MEEMLDIYTDKLKYLGVMPRDQVHKEGKWHKVIAVLLINPKTKKAYLQSKNLNITKKVDKSVSHQELRLDLTVTGHLVSGEDLKDSIREIKEEINMSVTYDELFYLGTRQCAATISNDFIANEFHECFLLPKEVSCESFELTGEEVGAIVEVDIEETIKLLLRKTNSIVGKRITKKGESVSIENIELTENSFLECWKIIDKFMIRMLIAAKRYIEAKDENEKELIFW